MEELLTTLHRHVSQNTCPTSRTMTRKAIYNVLIRPNFFMSICRCVWKFSTTHHIRSSKATRKLCCIINGYGLTFWLDKFLPISNWKNSCVSVLVLFLYNWRRKRKYEEMRQTLLFYYVQKVFFELKIKITYILHHCTLKCI